MDKGIRQSELARICDISASYLNLIEHNRRKIGGGLLLRIAEALDVDPGLFSEMAEVQLARAIDAAAVAFSDMSPEKERAEELAARFPGWARVIDAQQRELRRLEQVIERLGDRLTHDPFLSASLHSVLSSVTSIRSASAILASGEDVEPEWEARFHRNIFEDSQRLAEASETLVRYLDNDGDTAEGNLPQDELDAWLAARDWRIAELEDDPDEDLDALIAGSEQLQSEASREIARSFLRRYRRDVAALPASVLSEALSETTDAVRLSTRLGVPLPILFRRLAAVSAASHPDGDIFGVVGCDASGTLTFRKPLPEFALPRYGASCPFWPLFEAMQAPMTPVRKTMIVSARDEAAFEAVAYAEKCYPSGLEGPSTIESWMLFYSKRDFGEGALRVGTSCRICSERECIARREPPVFA